MMYRIIGAILVLLVVGGLYVMTEGVSNEVNTESPVDTPAYQTSPDDNQFKNLNIN